MAPGPLHWIFGYGSLVWRPAFEFAERRPAWISGWQRRFWQGSTDHRGVPGAPGRVVTVLPEPTAVCWGVAYGLDAASAGDVLAALDWREKGGYARSEVCVCFEDGGEESALMYAATPGNPNYLGPAEAEAIAHQVCRSAGPSGHNAEYVFELAAALRAMGADDPHVFEIEARVRAVGGAA